MLAGVWIGGSSNTAPEPSVADVPQIPQIGSGEATLDYAIPTEEPADVSWTPVDLGRSTNYIPVSVEHGPKVTDPGEWSGWAQTPTGALLAAYTIQQAAGVPDATKLTNYWSEQTINDPETLNMAVDTRPMNTPKITVTPMGFEVIEYSPVEVTVRYATRYEWGSQTLEESGTAKVQWQNGDWRLMMTADDRPMSQDLASGTSGGVDAGEAGPGAEWAYFPWGP